MVEFRPISPQDQKLVNDYFFPGPERGCEYNFFNLFCWGRQQIALCHGNLVFFSQYNRKSVYLFPVGPEDLRPTLEAVMQDAKKRGIPCRFTGMTKRDCDLLEWMFPGKFRFHIDRDSFDYIYSIEDLAQLKGRKFQRKRNHVNKFFQMYPQAQAEPLTRENAYEAGAMLQLWYAQRREKDPTGDFHMEQAALRKALTQGLDMGMEGLLLRVDGQVVAVTLASKRSEDTFDIHFEKALDDYDGAYAAINREFARYLQNKYPEVKWLNREDDLGIEGLRKAKLSYCPDRLIEKNWACLLEDEYDY